MKVKLNSRRVKVINNITIDNSNESAPEFSNSDANSTKFEDIEDLTSHTPVKFINNNRDSKNKFFGKLKRDHKVVDLFVFKKPGSSGFKSLSLLSKALECHVLFLY